MGFDSYLRDVVQRESLVDHEGKSGAKLERLRMSDGRRLIVKRFSPGTDLVMAVTDDEVGREYQLWSRGVLDQLPPGVGHAVVDGWVEPDCTVIVMRDLGSAVLTWNDRLTRERCRWVFGRVARMHRAFVGQPLDGLTPLPTFLGMFSPSRLTSYVDGQNPLVAIALRGWEIFADTVAVDVADPVLTLLADPTPLSDALLRRTSTLVHGDLATVNMALEGDQLTLLDWAMPAAAPHALDLARFLAGCASVVDASREQIISDFREESGDLFDSVALRLAMFSAVVWLGWNKALDAAEHPDPAIRAREQQDLDWWLGQARLTLEQGLL